MNAKTPMPHACPDSKALARALAPLAALIAFAAPGSAMAVQDPATVKISLSLTKYSAVETIAAGTMAGVKPAVTHVRVGDRIVFVNDDTDHHTATSLGGAIAFVDDPRWTDDALHASGEIGSNFWSTGDLAPGQSSAPLVARKAGSFLFGCFFDYGAGMRGEIVVEP